jgi:4Fe-4S ferredoxin
LCPINAISVEKPFEGGLIWAEDVSKTCFICVEVCPSNALFNKKAKSGERVEKITHRPMLVFTAEPVQLPALCTPLMLE